MASYPRMLSQLADPRRFPALTAFIAAGVFEGADEPDDEFVFGLDRILDGIEVLVQRLRAGTLRAGHGSDAACSAFPAGSASPADSALSGGPAPASAAAGTAAAAGAGRRWLR